MPEYILMPVIRRHYTTRALSEAGLAASSGLSGRTQNWSFVEEDEAFSAQLNNGAFRYVSSHSLLRPGGDFNQVLRTDVNDNLGVNTAPNAAWGVDSCLEFDENTGNFNPAIVTFNNSMETLFNAYYTGAQHERPVSAASWRVRISPSVYEIYHGASGPADGVITWSDRLSISNTLFSINEALGDFDFNIWDNEGSGRPAIFVEGDTGNIGQHTLRPFFLIAGAWSPTPIRGIHLYDFDTAMQLTLEGPDVYQQWVANDGGANLKILELRNTGGGSAEFRSLNDNGTQRLGGILTMDFATGNVGIGVPAFHAACVRNLGIVEGTAPGGAVADQIFIWAQDDGGTAEAYVQDGAGNQLKFSPHNKEGEWEFHCKNVKTGRILNIQMEQLVKFLDDKFGTNFLTETKSL